jgi:transcriptional regulator with XRE-family HTH domain
MRMHLNLNQTQFGARLGYGKTFVSHWERNGKKCPVHAQQLIKLMVRASIEPKRHVSQCLRDLKVKTPERFELTYKPEDNKWFWSNRPS